MAGKDRPAPDRIVLQYMAGPMHAQAGDLLALVLACLAPKEQRIMTHRRGLSMQFQLDLLRESLGEFGLHGPEVIMMVPRHEYLFISCYRLFQLTHHNNEAYHLTIPRSFLLSFSSTRL